MRKVFVSDFTLSKLAGERKNPLLFREKTAIASAVDSMGVDAIELAPITKEKEDTIVYKTIAANVKNAMLCLPVGTTAESVDVAYNAIEKAVRPCLMVSLPLSTVQMEYQFHLKSAKMLPLIRELVSACRAKCENVQFVAGDCTRADKDFLIEALKTAVEAGAGCVTLSDDAGILLPGEFAAFVKDVKAAVSVPVYVKVSDALHMATSTSFAAIEAGADGVKVISAGKDELMADRFADAITARGESIGVKTDLKVTNLATDVHALTNKVRSDETESGAQIASGKTDVLLDGESTLDDLAKASAALGYSLSDEDLGNVEQGLKRVCEKKGRVGSKELEALIAAYSMRAPSTYHLESYTASCSNLTTSMAHVILSKTGSANLAGTGVGDGPIDAAFGAIEQAVGYHYELDDFQINTVTEGKESLGSALIKLRSKGKLYSGNGISTDIVGACIRAYINALNKIVYEEE